MRNGHGTNTPGAGKVVTIARAQERRVTKLVPKRTERIEEVKQINAIGAGLPGIQSAAAIGFRGCTQFSSSLIAQPRFIERRIDFYAIFVAEGDAVIPGIELRVTADHQDVDQAFGEPGR